MGYKSLQACVADLEKHGHLIRIKEEVDPYLEMAAIHMRVYEKGGPALLFERVKGSEFPAVSNLFGTLERSKFIFRDTLNTVEQLVQLRNDPMQALKKPWLAGKAAVGAITSLPLNQRLFKSAFKKTSISKLPQIINWEMDGGPFITMPQVYTEDQEKKGVFNSNLGMYRIQLSGNEYIPDQEIGLHYQIHRGIGIHQATANRIGEPLKVSIFVGGPPAHPLAAVMPLPEGLPELTFAGALGGRRFRYFYDEDGFCISADADFVITGEVYPNENKPEGPFGDHLGYYSLVHPFPVMKVRNVYHREKAIWSFTVVGRPPQEDTSFGALIHEISGSALPNEIPGLKELNAVDAAGVHPLLFAIGSERYTPFLELQKPQELLTIANRLLGTNQLSLAKYLFIAAQEDDATLDTHDHARFMSHMLRRVDLAQDLHFYTNTTIDTLDYSGTDINSGSKLVVAAVGKERFELRQYPAGDLPPNCSMVDPGIMAMQGNEFQNAKYTEQEIANISANWNKDKYAGIRLIVLCDDHQFLAASLNNFLWVTFTRSNPAAD
ncbi:MAG: UbiD family decarboxylase, partial [Chitinophagaceae bacterium]